MKAAAFDLDDTLLRDDLSISPYTLDVFHRLADRGFFFIADSGRTRLSMKPHVEKIGCVSLYIACNGAEIYDGRTHELLHAENFSMETAHEIVDFGAEYNAYTQAYDGAHFYFNQYSEYSERYARTSSLSGIYVGDLRKFIREPRNKILMMAEPAQVSAMLAEARRGAVLLSPCVSDGEREIAREALAAGLSLVTMHNKGFAPLQKPAGRYFDACADGRLLMLAPAAWPHTPGEKPMTRDDATAMNRLCQWLAGEGAAKIAYRGITPADVDGMALRAVKAGSSAERPAERPAVGTAGAGQAAGAGLAGKGRFNEWKVK